MRKGLTGFCAANGEDREPPALTGLAVNGERAGGEPGSPRRRRVAGLLEAGRSSPPRLAVAGGRANAVWGRSAGRRRARRDPHDRIRPARR